LKKWHVFVGYTVHAFWPFKIVQGHRLLHESKARIWLPITNYLWPTFQSLAAVNICLCGV